MVRKNNETLLKRLDSLQENIPSKLDFTNQVYELRQRVNDIQAMENSFREANTQTVKNSLQSEPAIMEQKLSLGSQQRWVRLNKRQKCFIGFCDFSKSMSSVISRNPHIALIDKA